MISPIDNLIAMFFKWGMDMLSNITLASKVQCMKSKMLYDNYKRTKPLIRSNHPIITYHSYEKKSRTIEYDSEEEEDVNEIAKLFKNTFIKHFDKDKLKKKEEEVAERLKSLNVQSEVYLPTLTDEEKEELEKKHYVISKQWMNDKSKSCWGRIITRNQTVIQKTISGSGI
jgi:adenylate kinase family enzyme